MAVGKNKRLTKGKKGIKKKTGDPFLKKEWYDIKAPAVFPTRNVGTTLVNKTAAQKTSSEQLIGRVVEISLADLLENADDSFRNIRLIVNDVKGKDCITRFCGMNFTSDKLRSLVKKSHTLIETFTDIKTTDGYLLRVFVIGFTFRQKGQVHKTTYATTSKIKSIRRKMVETIHDNSRDGSLDDFIRHLISEVIGKTIEKACAGIFPLVNVHIRKVKVLKAPKYEPTAAATKTTTASESTTPATIAKDDSDEKEW